MKKENGKQEEIPGWRNDVERRIDEFGAPVPP